ncbi:MAG: TylF/MycF family methyltransferase [Siculibacillus sp.]|nr:TylF/MycF family methyltransferase [Siculibacillus sp.]
MFRSPRRLLRSLRSRFTESHLGAIARSVRLDGLTYLSAEKMERIERSLNLVIGEAIPGDFLEFGVALGGSAIVIADRAAATGRPFHGFDVFGMIPEPTSEKDDQKSKDRYRQIAAGKSRGLKGDVYYGYRRDLYSEVVASFERYRVPVTPGRIELHKGLFEDTVPGVVGDRPIAFAHIDCDWYDPVAFCLRIIGDRLAIGGIVVLDDYNDYGGCRTAVEEFITSHPEFELEIGASAVLRRT